MEALPLENLERIASYLDSFSLISFALSSPRFRDAALIIGQKHCVRTIGGPAKYFRNRSSTLLYLQSLNLSHCYESAASLESVIVLCPRLERLDVTNTNLKFDQILNIFDNLGWLAEVACGLLELPSKHRQVRHILAAQRSLQRLYLDCYAFRELFRYLTDFLNHCRRIRFVHLNFIGQPVTRRRKITQGFRQLPPISVLRWKTLHTVMGSFHMSGHKAHYDTIQKFLSFCKLGRKYRFIARKDMCLYQNQPSFEFRGVTEIGFTKNLCRELVRSYHIQSYIMTIGPDEHFLRFSRPKSIVELDLTSMDMRFSASNWEDLVEHTPRLSALAVHICSLPMGETFRNLHHDSPPQESYVIDALEKMNLTMLHIVYSTDPPCTRCWLASRRYIIGKLERLSFLIQFTLAGAIPSPILLKSVAHPKLRVMKLVLKESPKMTNFNEMLKSCQRLGYFKFEAPNLPLHSRRLWNALANSKTLKQICLASGSRRRVNLDMVRELLPSIVENLSVLHLHAERQNELFSEIEDFVIAANMNPARKKIRMPDASCPSLSCAGVESDLNFAIPGRNLCCTAILIGKIALNGWNVF